MSSGDKDKGFERGDVPGTGTENQTQKLARQLKEQQDIEESQRERAAKLRADQKRQDEERSRRTQEEKQQIWEAEQRAKKIERQEQRSASANVFSYTWTSSVPSSPVRAGSGSPTKMIDPRSRSRSDSDNQTVGSPDPGFQDAIAASFAAIRNTGRK